MTALDAASLAFPNLLSRALMDWPETVDLSTLEYSAGKAELYSVPGLYEIQEGISAKYYGNPNEILFGNLHWVLFITLHKAAKHCVSLKMSELRAETVRSLFEEWLNKAPIEDWGEDAIKLKVRYFAANPSQ